MDAMGYSLADIGAMLGNRDNGFLEGNGIVILLLFFLMLGGNGFGGWGSAAANQVTNDFLFNNLSNQTRDLHQAVANGFATNTAENFGLQKDILNQTNNINQTLCSGFNGITNAINCSTNGIQSSLQTLSSQMQQQCCDLKTTMHTEGELTRALIAENETTRLRTDLQSAQLTLANANQTQNILNSLGSYQPYAGGCGCNC